MGYSHEYRYLQPGMVIPTGTDTFRYGLYRQIQTPSDKDGLYRYSQVGYLHIGMGYTHRYRHRYRYLQIEMG